MASGLGTWVIGLAEHRRKAGHPFPHHLVGPLPGLAVAGSRVADDVDVTASLTLEIIVDGRLTAIGRVAAPWSGECRRCLQDVEGVLDVEVSEVFEADPADDADTYPLAGDRVDLEPMVRDAVLLGLPLAPLCRDDCAGPDPDDHPVGAGEREPAADPRWAALGQLRFE
jgi:uncharacterized protein